MAFILSLLVGVITGLVIGTPAACKIIFQPGSRLPIGGELPEPVDRLANSDMLQQTAHILHILAAAYLECRLKDILKAVLRIMMVVDKPANRLPHIKAVGI